MVYKVFMHELAQLSVCTLIIIVDCIKISHYIEYEDLPYLLNLCHYLNCGIVPLQTLR